MTQPSVPGSPSSPGAPRASAPGSPPPGLDSVLRSSAFWTLSGGMMLSFAGHWMGNVTSSWLLLELTDSAVALGALGVMRGLPFLLLALPAGALADRVDRRRLMRAAELTAALSAIVLAALVLSGQVTAWQVLLIAFVTSTAMSLIVPPAQAILPTIVDRAVIGRAIALTGAGQNAMRILGPGLVGLVMGLSGIPAAFLLQAGVFAAALGCTLGVPAPPTEPRRAPGGFVTEMADGVRYIRRNRTVAMILTLAAAPVILGLPYQQLLALFARDVYGSGPETLGLLFSANGIGAIVGTLVLARFGGHGAADRAIRARPLVLAAVAFGLALVLFALSPTLWLGILGMALVGVTFAVYSAMNHTALTQATEDAYRGRVMSMYSLVHGLLPLGALPAGLLASVWGAAPTVMLSGVLVMVVAVLVAWLARERSATALPGDARDRLEPARQHQVPDERVLGQQQRGQPDPKQGRGD